MTNHEPTIWFYEPKIDKDGCIFMPDNVADAEFFGIYMRDTDGTSDWIADVTLEEHAQLIAAAPELLEALKRATHYVGMAIAMTDVRQGVIQMHEELLGVIAKAEGRA